MKMKGSLVVKHLIMTVCKKNKKQKTKNCKRIEKKTYSPTRGSGRMKPSSSETWYESREKRDLESDSAAIEKETETQ